MVNKYLPILMASSSSTQVVPTDDSQTQALSPAATPEGTTRRMDPDLYKAAAGMKISRCSCGLSERHKDFERQRTPMGNTVLHIAAQFGKLESVRVILGQASAPSSLLVSKKEQGDTPLHLAAREGHVKVVQALINARKTSAAATSHDLESGVAFLGMVNKEGDTSLHEAVRYHHPEVVNLLVVADPSLTIKANFKCSTPLYMAAERGFSDLVSIILDISLIAPHDGGPKGRTALHAAVISKCPEMVKTILKWKPQLNRIVDEQGWTPLHCAAYLGYTSIAKLLIGELESCDIEDKRLKSEVIYMGIKDEKKTALHIAASRGNKRVARLLASHYPDCCEQVDNMGNNAIHLFMSQKRHFLTLFSIPSFRARGLLNGKNTSGLTPLHLLADSQMDHGTDFILSKKVDKMALNGQNLTAIDIISSADPDSLRRQHSISKKLKSVKARAGPSGWQKVSEAITIGRSSSLRRKDRGDAGLISAMKSKGETHLIIVTIIATITYAAGFTLPGGYNNDDGMAILTKKTAFQIFVVADTSALVLSMSAICVYFFMVFNHKKEVLQDFLNWGFNLTMYAMGAMMIAFVMGLYTVLPDSTWLVIFVGASCCCFFIFLFYILRKFYSSWKMMIKSSFWFRKFKLFVVRRRQLILIRRGNVNRLLQCRLFKGFTG